MYFIMLGDHTYITARLTEEAPGDEDLPFFIRQYDFDDESAWSDEGLTSELSRVSQGKDYDPYAMCAIDMEQGRRRGQEYFPTFDNRDDLMDFLMGENGDDDEDDEDEDDWDNDEDEDDWDDDRRPLIFLNEISQKEMDLIRKLADNERERNKQPKDGINLFQNNPEVEKREAKFIRGNELRRMLMNTGFAARLTNGDGYIEDMKVVAAHLLFLYVQERQIAEQEGKTPDESYYYAGSSLYNFAALQQMLEEDDDEDEYDEDDEEDEGLDLDRMMGVFAEAFSDHIKNADISDQFLQEMGESTDAFLKDKGFNVDTLSGLKKAQQWLENARVEDAFYTDDVPIDNAVDWHMGEARLAAMLKIVKDRIEKRMGKE